MKRLTTILGSSLALSAALAGVAAAASLSVASSFLGAGSSTVSGCGVSALSATRGVDNGGHVTRVDVYGIAESCSGQTLSVTLKGASGAELGSATQTIGACTGGCTATFTDFGSVSASSLDGYAFGLSG